MSKATVSLGVRITVRHRELLELVAATDGMNFTQIVEQAIDEFFNRWQHARQSVAAE